MIKREDMMFLDLFIDTVLPMVGDKVFNVRYLLAKGISHVFL
jgi:hypothetical protein